MASKLISLPPYESPNELDLSLRQSHSIFLPKLTPPLHLILPSPNEYPTLNQAILYGVLCEPTLSKSHLKHLHAIVNDGYSIFIKFLAQIVDELYVKMLEFPKLQLIWVTSVMIDVSGVGFESLLVSLLRQIVGGDFSDGNLWLSYEMVNLLLCKWDLILEENPVVLTYGLYTYLRLLSDHYRLAPSPRSMELKRKELGFCVRMLREEFRLCLEIGRDLIRLLQDLTHIPEFRAVWKDLVLNPSSFGVPGFSGVSSVYAVRTSSRYFSLRVTPEMETQLRFLLTKVKLGSQRRHQLWFSRKFLFAPERESLICDMVRFVCCPCRPSEEAVRNGIVPRWAVIGWLLSSCTKKYFEAKAKLALFYDWLFYDDKVDDDDDVMSIEPAMLLMVNSIPRYMDMTHSLLEFLLLLVENFDSDRKNVVVNGVSNAMSVLVRKGVISSLDVLTNCELLSPFLRKMLQNFMSTAKSVNVEEPPPHGSHSCDDDLGMLIGKIGENMKKSIKMGQETVGKILALLANPDSLEKSDNLSPEFVASEIKKQLHLAGYRLFGPIENVPVDVDDEVQSVTSMVIQTYIFSQHQCFIDMLLSWSRNGLPTRERLLSYVVRLAYEAHLAGHGDDFTGEIDYQSLMPLLKSHIEGDLTFLSRSEPDTGQPATPATKVDKELISKVINDAFRAYRIMFKCSDLSPGKVLSGDIMSCSLWKNGNPRALFQVIFSYLSDLALGDENVILLLVSNLDQLDIVSLQIDLTLKRFAMFGKDVENVLRVVRKSMSWDPVEQHKLWGLMRSEFSVSEFPVEKLLLDFFSEDLDPPRAYSIAMEGIMVICSSRIPTPELVGAVLLLPNNKFPDFVAAILSQWVTTNAAMLFDSMADFLDKLEKKNESIAHDWGGIVINQSAIIFLLKYLEAQGEQGVEMLEKLALSLSGGKKGTMENPDVAMDTS